MKRLTVSDIRQEFFRLLEKEEYVIDKTGCKMLEIRSASFLMDEDSIFGTVNWDYVRREIEWYDSMSLNVNDIPGGTPAIWKQVATPAGFINSNYGRCIYHEDYHNQYDHVLEELKKNPDSRRGVMIYNRPSMWVEYNRDGMSDFCCTAHHQYFIRDGLLESHVVHRSSDVVFGVKNDAAWARCVQERLATDLGVTPGDLYWNAGSLHVYSRHFHLVK